MSQNYYSEINLHIVWHTKLSRPLLTADIETTTHQFLRERLIETPGTYIHEIGGTATHVHLAISIPPTILISDLIGQLKGASAHHVNHTNSTKDKLLQWQTGYGVVSFGTKDLDWVNSYIRNQKEHHRNNNRFGRLERIMENDA